MIGWGCVLAGGSWRKPAVLATKMPISAPSVMMNFVQFHTLVTNERQGSWYYYIIEGMKTSKQQMLFAVWCIFTTHRHKLIYCFKSLVQYINFLLAWFVLLVRTTCTIQKCFTLILIILQKDSLSIRESKIHVI